MAINPARRQRVLARRLACTGAAVFAALALASPAIAAPAHGHSQGSGHGNSSSAPGHNKSGSSGSTSSKASSNHSQGNSGTSGSASQPQPTSNADQKGGGANGQCPGGPYCSTRDGSPSHNGNGNGKATGKPCAGCVGKADNKNPHGQMPNGSDHNNGYECDGNHGVGRSNPAHTGCQSTPPPPPTCQEEHSCPPPCSGSNCQPCSMHQCPPPCQGSNCHPCHAFRCPPPCRSADCHFNCEKAGTCKCPTDDSACPPPCQPGMTGQNCPPPCEQEEMEQPCTPPQHCVPNAENNFCTHVKSVRHTRTPEAFGGFTSGPPASLPFTGSPVGVLLASGLGTIMAGGILMVATRRRKLRANR